MSNNIYIAYFIALFTGAGSEISKAEDESLCNSDETMIATCDLKTEKSSRSICGIGDETVFYRSGTREHLDFAIEFNPPSPITRWIDLGTYTTYFGYRDGERAYILGVPEEKHGALAFLVSRKKNESEDMIECHENSFGDKKYPSKAIKDIDDDYARENKLWLP